MPEGHTLHRLARDQTRWLAGRRVLASSPQGRFDAGARAISDLDFLGADAWGKHLFHRYSQGITVHIHLGLAGRFRRWNSPPPEPRDSVRLRLSSPALTLDLSGPLVCALLPPDAEQALLARLGPDPLRADASPDPFFQRLARTRRPIGVALMDQSVIAGIGNVYRAELLFRAGVHPNTPANAIGEATRYQLWEEAKTLLDLGVRLRRIVTVDPRESGTPAAKTPRGRRTYVYGRRSCLRCGATVTRWTLQGRTAWACPDCQR